MDAPSAEAVSPSEAGLGFHEYLDTTVVPEVRKRAVYTPAPDFPMAAAVAFPLALVLGAALGLVGGGSVKQGVTGAFAGLFSAFVLLVLLSTRFRQWLPGFFLISGWRYPKDTDAAVGELLFAYFGARYYAGAGTPEQGLALGICHDTGLCDAARPMNFVESLEGTQDGVQFSLAEYDGDRDQQSGIGRYARVKRYLVGTFAFPRAVKGTTVIRPEIFRQRPARLSRSLQPVRLEDPAFERAFEVLGSDQVQARYLLTPAFMERLVKLEARLRAMPPTIGGPWSSALVRSLWVAYTGDRFVLVVRNAPDLFEFHYGLAGFGPILRSLDRGLRAMGLRWLDSLDPNTPAGQRAIRRALQPAEQDMAFIRELIETLRLGATTRV